MRFSVIRAIIARRSYHHRCFIDGILNASLRAFIGTCTYNGDLTRAGIDAIGIVHIIVCTLGQRHTSHNDCHIGFLRRTVIGTGTNNRHRSTFHTRPGMEVGRNLIVVLRVSDSKRISGHTTGIRTWV